MVGEKVVGVQIGGREIFEVYIEKDSVSGVF